MPRYRNPNNVDLEGLVKELVNELKVAAKPTPQDPLALAGDNPVMIETPTGLGEKFRVTVVWDKWGGLAVEDRNRIILEAYRRVLGAEAANLSLTLGVTRPQFQQMTTLYGQLTGA